MVILSIQTLNESSTQNYNLEIVEVSDNFLNFYFHVSFTTAATIVKQPNKPLIENKTFS